MNTEEESALRHFAEKLMEHFTTIFCSLDKHHLEHREERGEATMHQFLSTMALSQRCVVYISHATDPREIETMRVALRHSGTLDIAFEKGKITDIVFTLEMIGLPSKKGTLGVEVFDEKHLGYVMDLRQRVRDQIRFVTEPVLDG